MAEIAVPNYNDMVCEGPWLDTPAQVNRSAWTGRRKVVALPGAELWYGKVTLGPFATENEERAWRVFLFALRGMENWFKFHLPCATHVGNMPTVGAGSNIGYTLPLVGMTASTLILSAGQYLTVPLPSGRFRAVMLTSALQTNASGNATANFVPALTEAPTAAAAVETKNPYIPMSSKEARLGLSGTDGATGTSFDVEEAR